MNVSAVFEKGANTIVDRERKRRDTEWQRGGVLPAGCPIGGRVQLLVAVKTGKRLERSWKVKQTVRLQYINSKKPQEQ